MRNNFLIEKRNILKALIKEKKNQTTKKTHTRKTQPKTKKNPRLMFFCTAVEGGKGALIFPTPQSHL